MKPFFPKILRLVAALFLVLFFVFFAANSQAAEKAVGIVEFSKGKITFKNKNQGNRKAQAGTEIFNGDYIKTSKNSHVVILFHDKTRMHVGPQTKIKVTKFLYNEKNQVMDSLLDLISGQIRVWTQKKQASHSGYHLKTKNAVAGLRGTELELVYWSHIQFTMLAVFQGEATIAGTYAPETVTKIRPGNCSWVADKREASKEKPMAEGPSFFHPIGDGQKEPPPFKNPWPDDINKDELKY